MPTSPWDFAVERASASTGCAAPARSAVTAAARARSRARVFIGVLTTIVTRFKHRKLFRQASTRRLRAILSNGRTTDFAAEFIAGSRQHSCFPLADYRPGNRHTLRRRHCSPIMWTKGSGRTAAMQLAGAGPFALIKGFGVLP